MNKLQNYNKKLLKCNLNLNNLLKKQQKWLFNFKDKPKLPTKHRLSVRKIQMKLKVKEIKSTNLKIYVKLI